MRSAWRETLTPTLGSAAPGKCLRVMHAIPDVATRDADIPELPIVESLQISDRSVAALTFGDVLYKSHQRLEDRPSSSNDGRLRKQC